MSTDIYSLPGPSTISLPPYSKTAPPPHYSCEPIPGERRVEHTPRSGPRIPNGTFIKKRGSLTVVLTEQQDDNPSPAYGREAAIHGALLLEKVDMILSVDIKIEGRLDMMSSECGARSLVTVDDTQTLWTYDRTKNEPCPSSLSFSRTLPSMFKDSDKSYPLPPTYKASFPGTPGLHVISVYTLVVRVTSIRHPKFGFFAKTKTLRIPITYAPRTRPNRPTLSIPLFHSVKSSPEEWMQSLTTMKTKSRVAMAPIESNLFIPSVQIFSFSDIIPFHVQLSGPLSSLRQLFPHVPSLSSSHQQSSVTVTILRQIAVTIRGTRAWRNATIGEGKIRPVPPASQPQAGNSQVESLDWEGEVQCLPSVNVGGFSTAGAAVKDFIVLSLTPPTNSPFLPTINSIPIRLVTDSWIDTHDRTYS
ncbi:uncharacterized protein BT62DRAFT_969440 [Guyanagaster necrorhizus]|uniref:Uncharacterized protein n=1 Tax=Guyanagaster necrorhizus TaxID=856835 RepID=A0A9P8AS82_9AGAR|nr:uncharacterized protein BT62DRAFT_969440 [Guyanagaster necrorhizus MCA 3950]KAG7445716.1 hypothetical protein BT62DRAFT_969440 [Guyanagaster necrorhizus MCA 3950]